jgi:NAD-reducing hydrogenase large subunit
MARRIVIDPVTRIEGHARITIQLNDAGQVDDAHFHVTQLRGFEKFCEGRPFHEMPSLMARICGICPVSHLIASAKACDALLAVRIPPVAAKLRRVMNLAQIAQSHALSFFYLSSPDLLLGMDADPEKRSIFGVMEANPQLARDGVRLRQIGQQIIEMLGGKRIHPAWVVPGGVSEPLSAETRDQILEMMPEALMIAERSLDWFRGVLSQYREEILTFANFPTLFMGLIGERGELDFYDGTLRIGDSSGNIIEDRLQPELYQQIIGEAVEPHSYLKSPYYSALGYPGGIYRVGPLARLNIVERCDTPLADQALAEFRRVNNRTSSFHFHYARLIEIIAAFERIESLLNEPDILSDHVRAFAAANSREGIGVSEAPRGTLMHHYQTDENGLITQANLVIATGHNNLAMNRGVLQVARHFVRGAELTEGMLNRVEAVIRAFDPCLSCSTHDFGQMPLQVQLLDPEGVVIDEIKR